MRVWLMRYGYWFFRHTLYALGVNALMLLISLCGLRMPLQDCLNPQFALSLFLAPWLVVLAQCLFFSVQAHTTKRSQALYAYRILLVSLLLLGASALAEATALWLGKEFLWLICVLIYWYLVIIFLKRDFNTTPEKHKDDTLLFKLMLIALLGSCLVVVLCKLFVTAEAQTYAYLLVKTNMSVLLISYILTRKSLLVPEKNQG